MAIPTLFGSYIDETYERLVQVSGSEFADGLGNPITFATFDTGSLLQSDIFNQFTSSYSTGSFTGSFTGSLEGTASWAESASVALVALSALSSPATPPGGSDREIQFNSNGVFSGNSTFIFNYETTQSLQQGFNVVAPGGYSHAQGDSTQAIGAASHAEGSQTQAIGGGSHAEGGNTQAIGLNSHTEGYANYTYGTSTHAEGISTKAGWLGYEGTQKNTGTPFVLDQKYGDLTSTFGLGLIILLNDTSGNNVYGTIKAEVSGSTLSGANETEITLVDSTINTVGDFVIGIYGSPTPTLADTPGGNYSHTEGNESQTWGEASHAQGLGTIALGNYQQVQGQYNIATEGQSVFIIGNGIDNNNRSNLLFASGSHVQITGSLTAPSITGSLFGTASFATNALTASFLANVTRSIGIVLDGGGGVISTGIKSDLIMPYSMIINSWTLMADQTGSLIVDIWKTTAALYPPTASNTIVGSGLYPSLSGTASISQSTNLTNWNTTINSGDIIRFNVISASAVTRATLSLFGSQI